MSDYPNYSGQDEQPNYSGQDEQPDSRIVDRFNQGPALTQRQYEEPIQQQQQQEIVEVASRERLTQKRVSSSFDDEDVPLKLSEEIRLNDHYRLPTMGGDENQQEQQGLFSGLSWLQSTPTLIVAAVIAVTTIPPLIYGSIRCINSARNRAVGGATAAAAAKGGDDKCCGDKKQCPITDIEDCATTCSPDGCDCECPFPLKKHNAKQDGDKVTYSPIPVTVPADGSSAWICACGQSSKFPYCDGTHRAYNKEHGTSIGPYEVNQENSPGNDKVYICACGHSKQRKQGKPFCDGSHKNVKPLVEKKDEDTQPVVETVETPVVPDDLQ